MRSRWAPVMVIVALMVTTAATTMLYGFSKPDLYSSQAVVALTPRNPANLGATNLALAASRYSAFLSTDETRRQVAGTAGLSKAVLAKAAKVSVQPNTVTIDIKVTLRNADQAATVANALATTALRQSRADELVIIDLIAPAVAPSAPNGPNRRLLILGGLGAALAVGAAATVVLGFFRSPSVWPRLRSRRGIGVVAGAG